MSDKEIAAIISKAINQLHVIYEQMDPTRFSLKAAIARDRAEEDLQEVLKTLNERVCAGKDER